MRRWGVTEIAAAALGLALVVFFAGATAAVAAGTNPPTAMWAAGGAISGGLLGLIVPGPAPQNLVNAAKSARARAIDATVAPAAQQSPPPSPGEVPRSPGAQPPIAGAAGPPVVAGQPGGAGASPGGATLAAGMTPQTQAQLLDPLVRAASWTTVWALAAVFVVLLTLAVFLAGGAITPPKNFGNDALQNLIKTIVALASAAGTGVITLLAPAPSTGGASGG